MSLSAKTANEGGSPHCMMMQCAAGIFPWSGTVVDLLTDAMLLLREAGHCLFGMCKEGWQWQWRLGPPGIAAASSNVHIEWGLSGEAGDYLISVCLCPPRLPTRGALFIVWRCTAWPGLFLDAGDCLFDLCKRGRAMAMKIAAGRDCASLSTKAATERGSGGQH